MDQERALLFVLSHLVLVLLGRAKTVGAFVKRGQDSGYVQISLRGFTKEEILIITRKLDIRNKSDWLFNGKVIAKREIIDIIQKFNIQVNNLTQFLPQDRVCEFAKLTPVQLLEETEKAVGDPQLPIQHRALIDKSRELKNIELAIERNSETLNQLQSNNAEIEKDVKRLRQRDKLHAKVELMKKKLPWLLYDMKKSEYVESKERFKEAESNCNEVLKTLKDIMEPVEKQKEEKRLIDLCSKKLLNDIEENAKQRLEIVMKENTLSVELKGKFHEVEELRKQEETRQQSIFKVKEDLTASETELANLPIFEAPRDMLEKLGTQITEFEVSARQKRHTKSDKEKLLIKMKGDLKHATDRLKDMENISYKRLLALKRQGAEKIVEAYQWLQQHRDELNKDVFGPVLVEVNVPDRTHAAYLEGHLPYYAWKAFITQDPRDRDFLVKNLKSFDVPILNYVNEGNCQSDPFLVSAAMQELGICSRLDQVFDAPHAVKEVLIGQFGLANSYIGSMKTDQNADRVAKLGISDVWTPENHYRWSKSRYGGHLSAIVEAVNQSKLIQTGYDAGEIESLKNRKDELEGSIVTMEESLKLFQNELRTLENDAAELQKQREEIIAKVQLEKKKRRDLEMRVEQRKKKLDSMQNGEDIDTAISKLVDAAKTINLQRFECAIKMKNLLGKAISRKWKYAERQMASIEIDAKIGQLEASLKNYMKVVDQASVQKERRKKETDDLRQQLLSAKREAESVSLITPELERAFLEMPTTVEDLEAAIQDTVSQANSILCLNQNVLEEYEHRRKKIEEISKKIEIDTKELNTCLTDIESLKASWLPTLRNLVVQINHSFSRNFQEMAVAGEVTLEEHEKDFAQYGILIKVKFRQAEQLQVLSAHHQSGGERSVSTILYLVSLQDLTNCPFRVVDEINQGMDPINERKMFQQLVRASSLPNTPQCFLLTPKLLPNLLYSETCSILNIMNGPWIEGPAKVWSSGDCWRDISGSVR